MRIYQTFVTVILLFFIPLILPSQDIQYQPKEYIDEDGNIYWNKNLPLYLRVSPYPDGQGVLLKSKNPAYSNPIYLDTEGTNYIRTRYAVDKETKKTVEPLEEVMMPIIADGSGPVSSISYKVAKSSSAQGNKYFGPNLEIHITSSDKLSGLELLKYQIDNSGYLDYTDVLNISTEGTHAVSFYGVDRVGNKEPTHTQNFIVDLSPPTVTHNINGFADANVIASTSKIYFTATDELSGLDHIKYRFDEEEYKLYNGTNVVFTSLEDGDHTMEYFAVDKVGNKSAIYVVDFYYDKTAPLTASDILGDRFVLNGKIYFSGRTKMKLTAIDNKIGVKDIMYSINKEKFKVYDQPFYLPSIAGQHEIRYYSVDRLSNKPAGSESYKHNISLVNVDLTGPDMSFEISGPSFKAAGVQYISPETQIKIFGKDKGSGLQLLTYSIDGHSAETHYEQPITINSTGRHDIEFFGYDNVNNRNLGSTTVFVDATPPNIFENFSTRSIQSVDGVLEYPPYVTVFLAATDDIVGNDKIYYSINGSPEKLYVKPIEQLRKNIVYEISVRAVDKVGNESSRTFEFKTAEN